MNTLPTYFVSHGAGPWPFMKAENGSIYDQLEAALRDMPLQMDTQPDAILVISAHWEEAEFTVMGNPRPGMMYDFSGFPEHTYQIQYPAPGSPDLAQRVIMMIEKAGFSCHLNAERGFDHGMYCALYPAYPKANIPTIQLSLKAGLDPQTHIAVGRALAPLRSQKILMIGSGFSFHNLRKFGPEGYTASSEFDSWLQHTLTQPDPLQRAQQLIHWEQAPCARLAHPRAEHLLPLMVALGAAYDEVVHCVYHENKFMGGLTVSNFRFG